MDETQVNITLSFVAIKSVCEAIVRMEGDDTLTDEGEVRLAKHILGIIEAQFEEE